MTRRRFLWTAVMVYLLASIVVGALSIVGWVGAALVGVLA